MPRRAPPEHDKAKLTMNAARMVYDAAKRLSETRTTSVVDQGGKRPEPDKGPKEALGSPILFAVTIELALNGLRMEEAKAGRKRTKPTSAARHNLLQIFNGLSKENREAIANEVATLGWKVEPISDFHKAMVKDWRYPIDRMAADGAIFWWGAEPLRATFEGILATRNKRYSRPEMEPSRGDIEAMKRAFLEKRDEVKAKMDAARIQNA